jgi:hypothetical protein
MKPKEKADELLRKYWNSKFNMHIDIARECALIAVDELSKFLIDAESEDFNLPDEFSIQYWQEVKQEIEKI